MATRTVYFADGRTMEVPLSLGDRIRLPRPRKPEIVFDSRMPRAGVTHYDFDALANFCDELYRTALDRLPVDDYRIVPGSDGRWYAILD
jgi:hypothetical protein